MHPLAFDKEGRPFAFSPLTRSLLVRRFRKPGERGTCEALFDEDGEPLQVAVDTTVLEFRAVVNYVAALYRLDQLDEHGNEVDKSAPAYISIDPSRNAGMSGSADPLLVVRDMAQFNAEVTKTIATSAAGMMNAATENMRVAIGGGVGNRRLLGLLGAAAADLDDDDDDEGRNAADGGVEEPPIAPAPKPDPWAWLAGFAPVLQPMLPKIGEALGAKLADLMNTFMGKAPAAASSSTNTTASATASGPAPSGATASEAAAGMGATGTSTPPPTSGPSRAPSSPPPTAASSTPASGPIVDATAEAAPVPAVAADPSVAPTGTSTALATAGAPVALGDVRNVAPTGEQIAHLLRIRAVLTPREVAIVDGVIARMDQPTRAWWLAELSAMNVDQAAERVQSLIPAASKKAAAAGEE